MIGIAYEVPNGSGLTGFGFKLDESTATYEPFSYFKDSSNNATALNSNWLCSSKPKDASMTEG